MRSLDRHIFLDDSNEFADVQRQFKAAIHYARKHGSAIAIGHPRANTIAVLQAVLTIYQKISNLSEWATYGEMKKLFRPSHLFYYSAKCLRQLL